MFVLKNESHMFNKLRRVTHFRVLMKRSVCSPR